MNTESNNANDVLADEICGKVAEVLKPFYTRFENHEKYLKNNITAIIQGQSDQKEVTEAMRKELKDIKELVGTHGEDIQKLKRYANIENTIIRIFIAAVLAVLLASILHQLIW